MPTISSLIGQFFTAEKRPFTLLRCLVIILVGFAVYSTTFSMTFNFDDTSNILSNPAIRHFSPRGFISLLKSSRAVGSLSFLLNYQLHGTAVFGYHLLNVMIHVGTALSLYWLVTLLGRTWPRAATAGAACQATPVAFWAALLFVTHPVQTQAVTYIVQRFTSLAALFYLLAVGCYCRARLAQSREGLGGRPTLALFYLLALAAALLAIRSKEIAFTLPFAILLVEILFFPATFRQRLTLFGAFLGMLLFIPLTLAGTGQGLGQLIAALSGMTKVQTTMGRLDYLFTQFRVIVTYLRLLVFPVRQNLDYDYPVFHTFFTPPVFLSFLLLLGLLALALVMLLKSRRAGPVAPCQRLIAFGILWFFLALAVESSIIPIIDVIFEHRLYLPSAGAFMAIAALVEWGRVRRPRLRTALWLGMTVVCLVLVVATVKRNRVWRNEVTLWEDVTAKAPNNPRSWNNLGYAYLKHREPYKALAPLLRSIELHPGHPDAWNNIGMALDQLGRYKGRFRRTTQMFATAQSLESGVMTDWFGTAYNSAGLACEILGRYRQAAKFYQDAIGMSPGLGEAYYNLGLLYLAAGNRPQAEQQLRMLSFVNAELAGQLQQRLTGP